MEQGGSTSGSALDVARMPVCASGEPVEAAGQAEPELSQASIREERVVLRVSMPFGKLFASRPTRRRGVRRIAHLCDGRLANGPEKQGQCAKVEIARQSDSRWAK